MTIRDDTVWRTPFVWITLCIMRFIFSFLSLLILGSEIIHRRKLESPFPTLWFKYLSILSMIAGVMYPFFYLLEIIPGLCYFTPLLAVICLVSQLLLMGFYQLYRLYYCFANEQIHSHHGYPKCLFIIMYTMGGIIGLNFLFTQSVTGRIKSECTFHDLYYLRITYVDTNPIQNGLVYFAYAQTVFFLYYICDIFVNRLWCYCASQLVCSCTYNIL